MKRVLRVRQKGVKGHPKAEITQELVYKTTSCKTNQTPEHKPRECIQYPQGTARSLQQTAGCLTHYTATAFCSVPYCTVLHVSGCVCNHNIGCPVVIIGPLTCHLQYRATVFHSKLTAGSVGQENLSDLTIP